MVGLGILGFLGLLGYGQWAEDACIEHPRTVEVPEGSSGTQFVVAWPPGALRCRWDTPDGKRMSYTVTPL